MFPLFLAPPPLIAPCAESPLPEAPPARDAQVTWADPELARDPAVAPSLEWAIWQLIPSPELGFGDDGARFGLRWQLTPLLYSFATDARLNRWRWLVAEPIVRQSGSIELFLSPEYMAFDGGIGARFGGHAGLRAYFGLIGRGDQLSVSLGSSYYHFRDAEGVAVEAGAHILFGALGLVVSYAPELDAARWVMSLRLRYF